MGGVLSTYASWRCIFVINLPLGLAALLLAHQLVPDVRSADAAPLDWRGLALTTVGISALIVGIENLGKPTPAWGLVGSSLAVAGTALTAAVLQVVNVPRPLLDLRFLRIATYRVTAMGGSTFRAVITAIPFLLTLFFQLGFKWTAARAGLVVVALFVGNVGIKPATTPLMRRLGIRTVMVGAIAASGACLVGITFLQPTTRLSLLLGLLALSGVFRSIGFTAYNSVAFADIEPYEMTAANTLMSTVQALGAGLGIAIGAMLVTLGGSLASGIGLGAGPAAPYRVAFVILAVLLALPAVEALMLPRTAGNSVTGPQPSVRHILDHG